MLSHFEQLCQTIARLRSADGCPWDREQTHKSLTRYLLEETYEVLEAINGNNYDHLKDELGDLLLQIVLQSQLAKEEGHFDIEDVAKAINEKMIARHPHVFTNEKLETSAQVLAQWEDLKDAQKISAEGKIKDSALSGVPEAMPALLKALKISEKAVNQGFEWEKEADIWAQLESELEEFRLEVIKQQEAKIPSIASEELYLEMGDVLFTMVNLARFHKIDPEEALLLAIEKFKKRFRLMEKKANNSLKELSLGQLEKLWQQAKVEASISNE